MNKSKGFTIIELVVVIAIIAILAAIVLINVTGYINRGKDAAMQAEMHTLQTDAAANSVNGIYPATGTLCYPAAGNGFGGEWGAIINTYSATNAVCAVNSEANSDGSAIGTKWCACVKELSPATTTYWCVDSTGFSGTRTSACLTNCGSNTKDNSCPAS